MNRTQLTLGGLLVGQVLLLLLVRGPLATPMTASESRVLFPALESFTPSRVEIRGMDGEQVTLERAADGWGIAELEGYPVDETKLGALLKSLEGVEVRRPVVTSSRYHSTLKVSDDDHERRVRIWGDASEDPELDFFLGTSPNYKRIHLRDAGDDLVFEVQGLGTYEVQANARSWFQPEFVQLDDSRVTSFRLQNSEGSFELEKRDDGGWYVTAPASEQDHALDPSLVETMIRTAAQLRAAEPAGLLDRAAQGLDSPVAQVVLRFSEGDVGAESEITVLVGGPVADHEGRVYIAREGFDHAAQAYGTSLTKLVEGTLDDLEASQEGNP
jgi:Domain of unknown function (DUF4340)